MKALLALLALALFAALIALLGSRFGTESGGMTAETRCGPWVVTEGPAFHVCAGRRVFANDY